MFTGMAGYGGALGEKLLGGRLAVRRQEGRDHGQGKRNRKRERDQKLKILSVIYLITKKLAQVCRKVSVC